MSEGVIIQTITTIGLVVVAIIGNRKLNRIGTDAREANEQVSNTHSKNFRDDLDEKVEGLSGQIRAVAEWQKRTERWLRDLGKADHQIEDTVDREALAAARDLKAAVDERNLRIEELRRDIPAIVREAIGGHVIDCPLRDDSK